MPLDATGWTLPLVCLQGIHAPQAIKFPASPKTFAHELAVKYLSKGKSSSQKEVYHYWQARRVSDFPSPERSTIS